MKNNISVSFRSAWIERWHVRFLALIVFSALIATRTADARAADAGHWIATWMASPQPVWEKGFVLPANVPEQLQFQTIRQQVRTSIGGKRVRIVLSNAYGTTPLVIGATHVALAGVASGIVARSARPVTFGGSAAATIPPGARAISDPVDIAVEPLQKIAVTLFLPEKTPITTFHWDGRQTAYIADGNVAAAETIKATSTIDARLFLGAILVDAPKNAGAIVTLGDSITDGNGSTPNSDRRWPDYLAERMVNHRIAVLNAGISGAQVLSDKMGVNAVARFERDVLSLPHVKAVILLMGINDIGWSQGPLAPNRRLAAPEEIIAGYRQIIAQANIHQIRIIGATLTPFEDALKGTPVEGYYSMRKEQIRQAVNQWIRTSGEFDAVIDFDACLRDPARPVRMRPDFDSGDHLHPGDAGFKAMADGIDLRILLNNH